MKLKHIYTVIHLFKTWPLMLAGLAFLALPTVASAQGFTTIIHNLIDPLEASSELVAAVSYITGAVFLLLAFIMFRSLHQQQREPGKVAGIALSLIAGIFLVYFPSTIQTGGDTVFGGAQVTQGATGDNSLLVQ